MATQFDVTSSVYDAISAEDYLTYLDKAPAKILTDGANEFVLINGWTAFFGDVINTVMLNVNIFIPKVPGGMINRKRFKKLNDDITPLVKSAILIDGYLSAKPLFDQIITDLPGNYDYLNLRYQVLITA